MKLSMIAAMGANRVIGDEKGLPWRMPRDLRRFKDLTMGKPLIMGRRTAQLLGKPLLGRDNIVLTRTTEFGDGWVTATSVAAAVDIAVGLLALRGGDESMVIGGGEVYRQFLPLVQRVYLTVVEGEFTGSATFPFAELCAMPWAVARDERHPPDDRNAWGERFFVLERTATSVSGLAPRLAG